MIGPTHGRPVGTAVGLPGRWTWIRKFLGQQYDIIFVKHVSLYLVPAWVFEQVGPAFQPRRVLVTSIST